MEKTTLKSWKRQNLNHGKDKTSINNASFMHQCMSATATCKEEIILYKVDQYSLLGWDSETDNLGR